jgi:multiple sugar transport system substrate-binding protein
MRRKSMRTRKLSRRNFLRFAATAGVGAAAIACQPKTVIVEVEKEVEKEVTKVVKETVVVEKAVPQAEPVKLTFIHPWSRAIAGPVIEPMVRDFEESHPGLFVALTYGSTSDIGQMVMTAVAAGMPPSIAWGVFQPMVQAKLAVALNDYMDESGYESEQIYPYLKDLFTIDGKAYGIPIENSSCALWYHRPPLEEAGLEEPTSDWDWTDYTEYARKLTIFEGDTPVRYGTNFQWSWGIFRTVLFQAGGHWLNEGLTAVEFNSEAGVRAVQFLVDLVRKEKVAPPPGGGFEQGFVSQKYVMQYDGPWRWGNYIGELNLDADVVLHPKNPETGRKDCYVFGGALVMVKTSPEEQDATWTFLDWFLNRDNNARWAIETGYLPIRKDVAETQAYKNYLAGDGKQMAAFLEGFEYGHARRGSYKLVKYNETWSIFIDECWDLAMLGERSVEEGLAIAEEKIMADKTIFERLEAY